MQIINTDVCNFRFSLKTGNCNQARRLTTHDLLLIPYFYKMDILPYFLVFVAAMLVDLIPLIGPPAWTAMVFFQVRYGLDIWMVLVLGVTGSAIGRYWYSRYVPWLSDRLIKREKNEDVQFIGKRLNAKGWKTQTFVVLYTLMPLPTTPLFTAAGMARFPTIYLMPAFFVGKFVSDALMVFAGDYVVHNVQDVFHGLFSWKHILAVVISALLILVFLFIDWRALLQKKKFRLSFNIWK